MVNLSKLTIRYIEKIAQDCNISLNKSNKKADKIKTILNAGISDEEINKLYNKYFSEYNLSRNRKKLKDDTKDHTNLKRLEDRITKLEDQINYLVSVIVKSEVKLKKENPDFLKKFYMNLDKPKSIIKSILRPGQSISIDYLIKLEELQGFPIKMIELAVRELIFERSFNAFEGDSIHKLDGSIAVLTRNY